MENLSIYFNAVTQKLTHIFIRLKDTKIVLVAMENNTKKSLF